MNCSMSHSKFMGDESRAQIPLRITPEFESAAIYTIEQVNKNCGYQGERKYKAAKRWAEGLGDGEFVWLGISGAATPVGMGGLVADLIYRGLIDAVVSTGANVYHDLHFACGLPVRHGSEKVNDDELFDDGTTRIYTQFIRQEETLKMQDMINQKIFRRVLQSGRLKQPFSTAMMLYEFGMELGNSEYAVDREGSFVLRAAERGVPIFLDSGSNHSLGMDFSLLFSEGYQADSSPSKDILQAAALSLYKQPQLNVFLGEGGPRNFIQTTAPTAAEIFAVPFNGSEGCIRFTIGHEEAGCLTGSTGSEAKSWGKYLDASAGRDIVVWGEYTNSAPDVMAYIAGKVGRRENSRLIDLLPELESRFFADAKKNRPELEDLQERLEFALPGIRRREMELREKARKE